MDGEADARRGRRWPRALLLLLALVALALAMLWLGRKPLATRYADRFLAAKGVPARYRIADLGLGRQRLVDVVLGDPAHPDLVADWLEARTAVGLHGPYLTGVRGGHVRLRARLVNGRLSLGSLDRLVPPPSGKPFALPALDVDVEDARVRLDTPLGVAALKVSGAGRLDGGFDGRVAVISEQLGRDCGATRPQAVFRVRSRAPFASASVPTVRLTGPVRLAEARCAGMTVAGARATTAIELALGERPSWTVDAQLATGAVRQARATAAGVTGRVHVGGGPRIAGQIALAASDVRGFGVRAGMVGLNGDVVHDAARRIALAYNGSVTLAEADASTLLPLLYPARVAGTPLAPLADALGSALTRAAARFGGEARVHFATGPLGIIGDVASVNLRSASGARVTLGDGVGVRWTTAGGPTGDGVVRIGGGGLPTMAATLTQPMPGSFRAVATVAPYAAGGARLALSPVSIHRTRDRLEVLTSATLSGPFAGGRVDGLSLPIDFHAAGNALSLDRTCAPLRWERVEVSGLVLAPGSVRLCPTGAALVSIVNGRVAGGASLDTTKLTGRLGSTPVALAAAGARLQLGERGFALQAVEARLGQPGRVTRLDIARLDGRAANGGVAGQFAGTSGQIGAVPLLLSDAAGQWRFANGALTVGGGLTVSDAQTARPRFRPMPVRSATLRLAGNAITAAGTVLAPDEGRKVADVRLSHDLARGHGAATFTVPGLLFDRALQPDQLTPITFGVIADVRGIITGEGRIDWTPVGITSTGRFRTNDTDLAAAFGPVEGIAGEIRFTDLLNLQSAPDQQLTLRSVNPGIAVTNGIVRFQTLPNARVQVEGARWPFAGGTLSLAPTLLDFGQDAQRRMTFKVVGMAADQFLQQFDFKNLNATGVFDGELPMIFDASGGRIEHGRLIVRPGGGAIAYVGPISQKDIGFWPSIAFQALKSLRYRSLAISMDGPLAGEMVTEVRFAGVSQGEGAKHGGIAGLVVGRLQRLPFLFNIRIRAPFRGLLDASASFYDPQRLITRNLPQLIEEQKRAAQPPQAGRPPTPAPPAIQPPASRTVP